MSLYIALSSSLPSSGAQQLHWSGQQGRACSLLLDVWRRLPGHHYQSTAQVCTHTCTHTQRTHTHTQYTHTHTHTHSTHTHTHTHTHNTCIHTWIHAYTYMHMHTCTHIHHTHMHTCTHIHHTHMHTCTHAHTYTTHTCTAHTCTHMDMCTTSYPTLGLIYHLPTLSHFPLTHTPSLLTPHSSPLTPHLSPPPPFLSERRRRRCIRFSLHHKFQNKWSRKTISGWVVQSSEWLHHNYITDSTTCIGHAFHIRLIYYTFRWPIPVAMAIAYTTFWESLYPSDRANS